MTGAITDFSQFTNLRTSAGQNDPAALREVASQFEAIFLQTLLKNMRDASLGDSLLGDSDQIEMYEGMMDQQLALEMASGKGIGLADMLVLQLGGAAPETTSRPDIPFPIAPRSSPKTQQAAWSDPVEFAREIWSHAERAAEKLDVAPEAIVAQAALETGWGKHVMPDNNGNNSFNLFGIKANPDWQGKQVSRQTLEFEAGVGVPHQERAQFRAYGDVAATFNDYTQFLSDNPRYSDVQGHGRDGAGFASALQDSGYATDPNYAEKLTRILNGPTMRRVMAAMSPGLNHLAAQPIPTPMSANAQ